MSISMAGFTFNDVIVKVVSSSLSMGQIVFIRGFLATILLAIFVVRTGSFVNFATLARPLVVLRVFCEAGATICFLLALFHLPIALVSAVLQALPLTVTIGAALVFSEPVGWRRWTAISVGLAGVLIIVRPGLEGFSTWSLFALACVCFSTVRDLATRSIPRNVPTAPVSAATAAAVSAMGLLLLPFETWQPVALSSLGLLLLSSITLVFGYQFIIMAVREGAMSFIAPFRYTALLWSIVLGYLVFADVPDTPMLVGAAIVVTSGLYALYREQVVGQKKPITESTGPGMAPDGT